MSYSFTTDPIEAGSGEGAINEAIDGTFGDYNKKGVHDDAMPAVQVTKHIVHSMIAVLGPNVETYTISISGHVNPDNKKGSGKAHFVVKVDVTKYVDVDEE